MAVFAAVVRWPAGIAENNQLRVTLMSVIFVCGLFMVALEDVLNINKSATMLSVAATLWTVLAVGYHPSSDQLSNELNLGLEGVGSVILFLLPAMGVIETIDFFDGFEIVTHTIYLFVNGRKQRIMPIIGFITFFLSSVVDNLTATIVALKMLRHVCGNNDRLRHASGALVVICANAGGAWSPIGDVTTTMLWIEGKITTTSIVKSLGLPSLVAGVVPLVGMWWWACRSPSRKKKGENLDASDDDGGDDEDFEFLRPDLSGTNMSMKVFVLCLGLGCILMVPVLKIATGLPPYIGMLFALGMMWLATDLMVTLWSPRLRGVKTEGVVGALRKVDLTGLLFFAGILLAVGSLDSARILRDCAKFIKNLCGDNINILCAILGLASSVVDNVPLVEATIDMFTEVPQDDPLWHLIAFAAGTGGSLLSIGSIAGVTFMSMENVSFMWYLKNASLWAAFGFGAGMGTYKIQSLLLE